MDYSIEIFAHPATWISLLTLTFLEIVLGVDNIIFISLVANKLPQHDRKRARNIGLGIALGVRVLLLMFLSYIIGLTQPLFTLPIQRLLREMGSAEPAASAAISFKDLVLIIGGLFLIAKSTSEIHEKVGGSHEEKASLALLSKVICLRFWYSGKTFCKASSTICLPWVIAALAEAI